MPQDPGRPPPGSDDPAERLAQFERARGLEHDALVPGYDEDEAPGDEDQDDDEDEDERDA